MLIYPGFTALDFVGPFHFLAGMGNVQVHVVTNQADLSPVPSDQNLMIQPTTTIADCPADNAVSFVPGGRLGTLAAERVIVVLENSRLVSSADGQVITQSWTTRKWTLSNARSARARS